MNKMVIWHWAEPEPGSMEEVWSLTDAEWLVVEEAVEWMRSRVQDDWGGCIAQVHFAPTRLEHATVRNLKTALEGLALQHRYGGGGEDCYGQECLVFAAHGIERG